MSMPLRKPLTRARRRALKVLASAPEGHTEAMMRAQGFAAEFLAHLVKDGLVHERVESVMMSNRSVEVTRMQLNELGRRSLGR